MQNEYLLMSNELLIRNCTKEDSAAIFRMICTLEGENPDKNAFEKVFFSNLEKKNIYYVKAEVDNKTAGFISMHVQELLHHTGKVAEIQEMYIEEAYRNSGYGEELLWYLRDIALNEGCRHFEVSCNIIRDKTLNFFTNRGMQCTHYKFTERL